MQAHGTRYILPHEPLVVFDLMKKSHRITFAELKERLKNHIVYFVYNRYKKSMLNISECLSSYNESRY